MILKKLKLNGTRQCACGSAQSFDACCGQWLDGLAMGRHASSPEILMRSRYSAYVLGDIAYLMATWHPSTAPGELELPPTQWVSLRILHVEQSLEAGVVEFLAIYKVNGKAAKMHEVSRFSFENGRWLYIDGQIAE